MKTIYGMGTIGALVYFMIQATNFTSVIFGFVKAIFWPAVVVYKAFELMGL